MGGGKEVVLSKVAFFTGLVTIKVMIHAPLVKIKEEPKVILKPQELRRFFTITSELSDLAEDILERRGGYSEEFLSGLHKSLKEARAGKLREITSLAELR